MKLVAIVLTVNDARHLPRCLASPSGVAYRVLVADCFSTDETLAIAQAHGARVVQRAWVNHATQLNRALTQLDGDTVWVLRLDADEYLTPELAAETQGRLPGLVPEIDGVFCGPRMSFQGRLIRYGGGVPSGCRGWPALGGGSAAGWVEERNPALPDLQPANARFSTEPAPLYGWTTGTGIGSSAASPSGPLRPACSRSVCRSTSSSRWTAPS